MNAASATLLDQIEIEIQAWGRQIEDGTQASAERLVRAREALLTLPARHSAGGCTKTAACAAELRASFISYSDAVNAHADQLAGLTAGLRDLFRDLKAREYSGLDAIQETFTRLGVLVPEHGVEAPATPRTPEDPRGEAMVTPGHVEEFTPRLKAFDGHGNRRLMGDILVEAGIVTRDELADALQEQEQAPHRRLGAILMKRGYTNGHLIARVVASQLQMPFVDLQDYPVKPEAVALINRRLADLHNAIPIDSSSMEIIVAMTNPMDMIATDDIERVTSLRVIPVIAAVEDIREAIGTYYGAEA